MTNKRWSATRWSWRRKSTLSKPFSDLCRTSVLGFAGWWETWHCGDEPLDTFTILTTDANATVTPTHDRMPVIVDLANYATWLDATKSADGSLLRPYPAEAMTATAVSMYANNAQHQGPECIAAVGA
jgi:putative SOS response-associated peptidase YedK